MFCGDFLMMKCSPVVAGFVFVHRFALQKFGAV